MGAGIREKIIEVMAMLDVELPPELVAPAPAPKGKASGKAGLAGEEGEGRRLTVTCLCAVSGGQLRGRNVLL